MKFTFRLLLFGQFSAALLALGVGRPAVHAADPLPKELAKYEALIKPEHRTHWAFQPVKKPAVPTAKNAQWACNPIDAFVLARLETQGWQPAPPADPRSLLRRLYLDVIGVPPTLTEQESFLKDSSC